MDQQKPQGGCRRKFGCEHECMAANTMSHDTKALFNPRVVPHDTADGFLAKIQHATGMFRYCELPTRLRSAISWARFAGAVRFRRRM